MQTTKQIVIFGRAPELMNTRLRVLATVGFNGQAVTCLADLVHSVCAVDIDLVLLCQSLSMDEVRSALEIINQVNPVTPILRVSHLQWEEPLHKELVANANESPHELTERVKVLIR